MTVDVGGFKMSFDSGGTIEEEGTKKEGGQFCRRTQIRFYIKLSRGRGTLRSLIEKSENR